MTLSGLEILSVREVVVRPSDLPLTGASPDSDPFTQLKLTVKEKGLLIPIFLNAKREVVTGHYRFWAAKAAGMKEVPVIFCSGLVSAGKWFAGEA